MRRLKLVLLAPVLFSALAGAASSGASAAGRKPQFVIDAERNYAQARQERVVAQERVARGDARGSRGLGVGRAVDRALRPLAGAARRRAKPRLRAVSREIRL